MGEPPYRADYSAPWPPPPPIPPPPARRPPTHRGLRRLTLAVAAVVVLGVGGGVWALSSGGESGREVSRESFEREGQVWPLTVSHGRVDCEQGTLLVFTSPSGARYGINGTAQTRLSLPSIESLWAESPDDPGLRVDITDLFTAARREC